MSVLTAGMTSPLPESVPVVGVGHVSESRQVVKGFGFAAGKSRLSESLTLRQLRIAAHRLAVRGGGSKQRHYSWHGFFPEPSQRCNRSVKNRGKLLCVVA